MNTKAHMLILIISATALSPFTGSAQQVTIFDVADKNKDGFVDGAEFESENLKSFKRFDIDGNGKLSQAEMAEKFKGLPASEVARGVNANLALMDSDKDGTLSWEEFENWYYQAMFKGMDKDNDGRLSKAEFILNENAP